MKTIRTVSKEQILVYAKNFLMDYEDEIEQAGRANSPTALREWLVKLLVSFDEYLES